MTTGSKAGSVALVGRPNAGKSTLMNHLLGEKVAIVSDKPQTTRYRLVGILSDSRGQMVFHDTPGMHKPLHQMNRQMVRYAVEALNAADVSCLLIDSTQRYGSGDEYLLDLLSKARGLKVAVLNKIDRVDKPRLLPLMERYGAAGFLEEIVPISALHGDGCDMLLDVLWKSLPEGEPIYDQELFTLHPERFLVAELIREKVLLETRDELPYTTTVLIDHWEEATEGDLTRLHASILVERPGQKAILIGRGGTTIKKLGTAARLEIESFLGRRVYLDLRVKLEPRWRDNRKLLANMDRELWSGETESG
ncbi:MAG: GTPase Era [Acidobacteriota bacterium]|nr:GTPase Era [Acidobacteriota bacterium]